MIRVQIQVWTRFEFVLGGFLRKFLYSLVYLIVIYELKYYLNNLVKCLNRSKFCSVKNQNSLGVFIVIDGLVTQNDANPASNLQNKLG